MTTRNIKLLTVFACLIVGPQALADGKCSTRVMAGKWIFATGVGHQMLGEPFPPDKDVTAIGTMNITSNGSISGKFDVTIQDFAFIPNLIYTGSMMVNPDCTGMLSFVSSAGTVRTDSIVVVNRREMIGMSQDPLNLWTYQVRRISGSPGDDRDDQDRDD